MPSSYFASTRSDPDPDNPHGPTPPPRPRAPGRRTLAGPLPSPPGLRLHGPGAVDGGEPRPPDPALRREPGRGEGRLPRQIPMPTRACAAQREAARGRDALGDVPVSH